jgi:hypothetical protein
MTITTWDYTTHPGDCHERAEDGVWTVCCRECAGTGVFPVPWINSVEEGRGDPDACSCVACKGTGRSTVGLAADCSTPDMQHHESWCSRCGKKVTNGSENAAAYRQYATRSNAQSEPREKDGTP